MFDLDVSMSLLLILFILAACSFEFVNGFHDTANAVATVIYTNTLKPWFAVIWSGFWNFLGVYWGGIAVAMGIVNLLPLESLMDQNLSHSMSMVAALLLSAIFWNLLTWYYGIPCSSSHTLISAILGVGIAYYLLPEASGDGVNWTKAKEIGLSLLLSPAVGFTLTILLMLGVRYITRGSKEGEDLFREPKKNSPPPFWIRAVLVVTCTLVSFFHGSNDGQKGVGLVMLILIAIVPTYFALNSEVDLTKLREPLYKVEAALNRIDSASLSDKDAATLSKAKSMQAYLAGYFNVSSSTSEIPSSNRFVTRKNIVVLDKSVKTLLKGDDVSISDNDRKTLESSMKSIRTTTDYSPTWVLVIISLSLGVGTVIGWKRIVRTIGEKIGKEHLNYAQGASAEFVASTTIGLSSFWGWPVSTTQILSSAVAGSMVASRGVKNLQLNTVRNILVTWALTLPVVVMLSGSLFLLFRNIFG